MADNHRLEQLFSNLLENSIRYTDAGGVIEVGISILGTQVKITIDDSAPGVELEQQQQIFERLYRLENSRSRATGGAGLGLAICKNIVSAHQGKIAAGASALGGLQICIELPKA
jgi:two-component system sensor histidine kinase BaeS